jgi:hypothetical protein
MQCIVSQPPQIGQMLMFHIPEIKETHKRVRRESGIVQNYLIQRLYMC